MGVTALAAGGFAIVVAGVIAFQIGLALGAPWGSYAMGGAFPGRFPPRMRGAALVQAALLAVIAVIVLSRAGLVLPGLAEAARWLIWAVGCDLARGPGAECDQPERGRATDLGARRPGDAGVQPRGRSDSTPE